MTYGSHVMFQSVLLDTRKAFDVNTGLYTITQSGVYAFTWSIHINSDVVCRTQLTINGVDKGHMITDGRGPGTFHDKVTNGIVVTQLAVGDRVSIQQFGANTCTLIHDIFSETSFSGWLISP